MITIPRNPPPFQTSDKVVTMKLAFELLLASTVTGAVSFTHINVASVNDPMGAIGTRRPNGSTVLFEMYKYGTVLSADLKLTALTPFGDSNPVVLLTTLQNVGTASTTIGTTSDFYETSLRFPGAKVKMFGNYITKNLDGNNSIVAHYDAAKYFGNSIAVYSDPAYASTDGANPTNQPFVGFYWGPPVGASTSSGPISFIAELTQVVRWWGNNGLIN